jgi:hypothetical protein
MGILIPDSPTGTAWGVDNAFAQFEQHGAGFEAQRPGYVFIGLVAYI